MPPAPEALITGGHGDFAAAIRDELLSRGWKVLAPGREELDVTSTENVRLYFGRLQRLDLLVNNAGICRDGLFLTQSSSDRDAVLDVCLRGAFLCSREAARLMMPAGQGHIVNIGSHSALTGPAGQTAYAAAKAGLAALTKSLAAELGASGVRVNCVLPGWLDTRLTRNSPNPVRQRALDSQTLGRFTSMTDSARFIATLHELSAISGQVFHLDSRITRGLA